MFVTSIHITRVGHYGYGRADPSKPFEAAIQVDGDHGEVKLKLSQDMSRRIVEIIAEEVAAAGRATAEAMTADVLNIAALAPPEAA